MMNNFARITLVVVSILVPVFFKLLVAWVTRRNEKGDSSYIARLRDELHRSFAQRSAEDSAVAVAKPKL